MSQPTRADQFLYGRYNDIVYPLLFLYALTDVEKDKSYPEIVILIFWAVLGLLTYYYYVHYYIEMSFMKFNVINLSLFYAERNKWVFLLIYSIIIIMAYIMVLIYKGKYRLFSKTIGMIAMMLFSYESAINFTNERITWSNHIDQDLKAVSSQIDESKNIYFSNFTIGVSFLQAKFPEKRISQYQNEQEGYLVMNREGAFSPSILSKNYIGTIADALVFSLEADSNESFNLLDMQMSQFHSDGFMSDLSSGFLVYGPYAVLNAGNYILEVELELYETSADDIGYIDVANASGTQIIHRKNIGISDFDDKKGIFKIPFTLEKRADTIEFRVYNNKGVKMRAKSVILGEKE
jgi:hypothetical protein